LVIEARLRELQQLKKENVPCILVGCSVQNIEAIYIDFAQGLGFLKMPRLIKTYFS